MTKSFNGIENKHGILKKHLYLNKMFCKVIICKSSLLTCDLREINSSMNCCIHYKF